MRGDADAPAGTQLDLFARELDRLVQELWTWSPTRWTGERIAIARRLGMEFVGLAEVAPPDVLLPEVQSYGLADQLAVLGNDLLAAPNAERAAAQALSHLAAARAGLT